MAESRPAPEADSTPANWDAAMPGVTGVDVSSVMTGGPALGERRVFGNHGKMGRTCLAGNAKPTN